jgi:hypothetical protein
VIALAAVTVAMGYDGMMRMIRLIAAIGVMASAGCGGSGNSNSNGGGATLGEMHQGGQYNNGPVDWSQSAYHNACGPYTSDIQKLESSDELLAGLDNSWAADGHLCDVCVLVTTPTSRSVLARVVTYGVSKGPNDLDLSPAAYRALSTNEYPRAMTWQLASCSDSGKIVYQFQTGANPWWTSLWVRDARLPLAKVEVKSVNHKDWFALMRNSDGTLNDGGGFGMGAFSLRVTAVDGQTIVDDYSGFKAGDVLTSSGQFQ